MRIVSRSGIAIFIFISTLASGRGLDHGTQPSAEKSSINAVTPTTSRSLLDSALGTYFGRIYAQTGGNSKSALPAFIAERSVRATDNNPFMSEGPLYEKFFNDLKFSKVFNTETKSWQKVDTVQVYREARMELDRLESAAANLGDQRFLFHAEKALQMAGYNWKLFSRDQYLQLFGSLRGRLQP